MSGLWLYTLLACGAPEPTEAPAPAPTQPAAPAPKPDDGVFKAGQGNAIPGRFQPRADDEELEQLLALGYVSGTEPTPDQTGVLLHDADRAWQGVNLYVSGQGPEAHLMAMDGTVLHRWRRSFFDLWPDFPVERGTEFPDHWRRAALLPDGDLIVVWGGKGIARLAPDSTVRWKHQEHIHHDLEVMPDGTVWTLSRGRMRVPALNEEHDVVMDEIVRLDPEGRVVRREALTDCFLDSSFAPMIHRLPRRGDILHTNTLSRLDGRGAHGFEPFSEGRWLTSFRRTDTIAALELGETEGCRVTWTLTGQWRAQHQPVLLDDGHLLLFDNRGLGTGHSRVLELDPLTQKIHWSWGGSDDQPMFSKILGSVQRLPNGNTLISESDNGRVLEVTPDGEIVWLWVVPHTAKEGAFVASVYELVRLPPDTDVSWARAPSE